VLYHATSKTRDGARKRQSGFYETVLWRRRTKRSALVRGVDRQDNVSINSSLIQDNILYRCEASRYSDTFIMKVQVPIRCRMSAAVASLLSLHLEYSIRASEKSKRYVPSQPQNSSSVSAARCLLIELRVHVHVVLCSACLLFDVLHFVRLPRMFPSPSFVRLTDRWSRTIDRYKFDRL